jgi:two-component system, OmpR family, sensor histidine kinase MtrB
VKGAAAAAGASYRSWLTWPRSVALSRSAAVTRSRRWLRRVAERYRHSLQLRVVSATLILSAVVVTGLGYILMQHLVAGIYANMQQTSLSIANAGLGTAQNSQPLYGAHNSATRNAIWPLAESLQSTGGTPYAIEVAPLPKFQGAPIYSTGDAIDFYRTPNIPATLTNDVVAEWNSKGASAEVPWREWTSMAMASGPRPVPGLLIGVPFGSGFALYYFFPLATAEQTVASIQQSLLVAGIVVVFLLAAIAWLVTRWVVIPVRMAAQGARRLSTGELNLRMEVRGSDELAALATSFNDMAASLQEKLAELEDLSQVQRQFVSDVSHELRTPLTTIRIASDVLYGSREEMGQAAARSAELMQGQLERFESLLTDLLEISRYDANAATLDAEPVDLCGIVLQSADVAQQLAERKGTKIEFRVPAEPCIAEIDRRRVERILRNLLLNAVEHGEDKDTVVTVGVDSAAVAVSVRDFGVGLRPGEEQLVFDRFWRADPARARTSGGTGLGLAIALEDARLHGGWLEAWGERGQGSVFRLTLPRTAGGELHGSPLPLSPLPLTAREDGIDTTQLAAMGEPGLAGGDALAGGLAQPGVTDLVVMTEPLADAESVLTTEPAVAGPGVSGQVPDGRARRAGSQPAASEVAASG